MSYEPKTWECGDIITAEDLNHMEQGIVNSGGGNASLIIRLTGDEVVYHTSPNIEVSQTGEAYYTDKTLSEVSEAINDGRVCLFYRNDDETSELHITAIDLLASSYCGGANIQLSTLSSLREAASEQEMELVSDDNPTADTNTLMFTP